VWVALNELGHDVRVVGVSDDLGVIRSAMQRFKPHIVFNLLEHFHGLEVYVPYLLGFLEIVRQPYTGCNPRGLLLTYSKALTKKILSHHRVPVPAFAVFARGKRVRKPQRMTFPLIVKSTTSHGSVGIAQASIVYDEERLGDRVSFVHEQLQTDAIAEQFIEGRELYVGLIGNRRLQTFPVWEMIFDSLPDGTAPIATDRVKHNAEYRIKSGIRTQAAEGLPEGIEQRITKLCKRVYRILGQSGYARMDLRLTPEGKVYLIESNPNPELAHDEDFAESSYQAGMTYNDLVQRIVQLGLQYKTEQHG
jgi:D-alanine-D-alanine ligase